jgi:gamma-D-glutamyl-L-lysine dipeptidyl-peptidase
MQLRGIFHEFTSYTSIYYIRKNIFMDYAVVAVAAAPIRLKAKHQREMVSQLLFGETVKVVKEKGNLWVKIKSLHDNYAGWTTKTLLQEITEEQAMIAVTHVTEDLINSISIDGNILKVPMGCSLPAFENGKGRLGAKTYEFTGNHRNRTEEKPTGSLLETLTRQWLNAPYCWGGRTLFGVDCSGFVQVNYKMIGIDLPRDAWQQAQEGEPVKKLKDAATGDLAFFDDKEEIVHVGILLGKDHIIHASGKVRIDAIDKTGIINSDTGKYTHRLKAIRRFC